MNEINLYKFNTRSGLWEYCRTCNLETKENWIKIYKEDEPQAIFKLSKTKPK